MSFLALTALGLLGALWLRGGTDATVLAVLAAYTDQSNDEITEVLQEQTLPEVGRTQRTPSQLPQAVMNASGEGKSSDMDYTKDDFQVCSRPKTKARSETVSSSVYQWTDAGGQTHMADKRPRGRIASVMEMGPAKRDFTYEVTSDGFSMPAGFEGQLNAGSKRMYDTWHFFLGEENLRQSRIQLLLIGGPERFNAYRARVSPGSKPVSGFYRMKDNKAVVKFDSARLDRTLGTSFHEISHLITASHLGPSPTWLNEGLAEYFETLSVERQAGVIHPNRAHIKRLKGTTIPNLRDFLLLDGSSWYGKRRDRNYALAWSLIHFMLGDASGVHALQELVQNAEAHFCKPFSAVEALDKAYPGGIRQLDVDWRRWLNAGKFQTHHT